MIVAPVGVTDRRASTRGGFADRLGSRRPAVDALVAESAARKRAEAAGIDPDDEPEVAEAARLVSMSGYLSRRFNGVGYDPLCGLRGARPRPRR